jgi:hypothetical protein
MKLPGGSVGAEANIFPTIAPEALSTSRVSLTSATHIPKPRRKQIEHVYSALYYEERVKAAVDVQIALEHSQPLPPGKARWDNIVIQQRITKETWESETVDIQEIVKKKQMLDYEMAVKEWEEVNEGLRSVEKQQM